LVGEDAAFEGLARHPPVDDGDAGAAVAVLAEELDLRRRQCREVRRSDALVRTVDLDGEVEALSQVDACAGRGNFEGDVREGGEGGEREKQAVGYRQ
jgi:hypothetical protein